MTTEAAQTEEVKGELTTTGNAPLPAEFNDLAFADAGAGLDEVGRDDIAIPFLRILEALSDELQKSKPEYIAEAEQGDIFNTVSNKFYNGEKGIIVIPVAFVKSHIVWKPRAQGGGLVHNYGSDTTPLAMAKTGEGGKLIMPDGNELVVSANYYVYLVDEETGNTDRALIAMSGTRVKHSKRWMAQITGLQLDRPDGKGKYTPPIFYQAYRLTTSAESNEKGTWYVWNAESYKSTLSLTNGETLYKSAREFNKAVMSGKVKVPDPVEPKQASASNTADLGDDIPF